MNSSRRRELCALTTGACLFVLAGCTKAEPKVVHHIVPANEGHRLGCQLCYDEMVRVLTGPPKHRRYKSVERHHCVECTTVVAFYVGDDGRVIIRCARCAPEGMACDRCLPPIPSTTQPAPATSTGL